MPKTNTKRMQAGWVAFGLSCAFALMGMVMSPRAVASAPAGVTMPIKQIYLTGFFGAATIVAALVAAVLLLRLKHIMRMRNVTILMLVVVLLLIGLFEVNWARDLI